MSATSELLSKDIVDLQDLEQVQYLQTLQADPAAYAAYIQEKSGRIMSEVLDSKRAAFAKTAGDMARMMDMNQNSLAALDRSQDMLAMQDHLIEQQAAEEGAIKSNQDNTRRQVEINNWYYENKRETLFVLQLALLAMLTVVVVLAAAAGGWIGEAAANYLMLFIVVVAGGTWLYRWYYTTYIRARRLWARRYSPEAGRVAPPSGQICIGAGGEAS